MTTVRSTTVPSPRRTASSNSAVLLLASALGALALGCGGDDCDCPSDVVGLVNTTGAPVSDVQLSGPACSGGRFRCIPDDFDDKVHPACTRLQIEAHAEGTCVVNLTIEDKIVRLERQMSRRPAGCCGGFIGEATHAGEIDLRPPGNDGGAVDGPDAS
jgi:hypothetical protein